jgi:hypothetical protein
VGQAEQERDVPLILAVPASAAPGVGGFPVEQYAPRARYVTVTAYNPSPETVLVSVGSDVDWLVPAVVELELEPQAQVPVAVEILRPVPEGDTGHVTLTVQHGNAIGGVGLAIVNAEPPGSVFPIVPLAGVAMLRVGAVLALALLRRRSGR